MNGVVHGHKLDTGLKEVDKAVAVQDRNESFVNALSSVITKREPVQEVRIQKRKTKKRGLFISYSFDAPYEEKKFVLELVKQLGEIGMQNDIWFDRDVLNDEINSPYFLSSRLEAAERCKGAILVLSESYFTTNQTRCEADLLLSRIYKSSKEENDENKNSPELFTVKFSGFQNGLVNGFESLLDSISVNLSCGKIAKLSEAEKVSMFIAVLNKQLEEISNGFSMKVPKIAEDFIADNQFRLKPLISWTVKDVQDWLVHLKIHEKYIISFEEFEIDGFLLKALTDFVLSSVLAVDSQICRRKILQRVKLTCEEEARAGKIDQWTKYRNFKSKPNHVYLIQDPSDEELGDILKHDLQQKGIKVLSHSILGQSKEEFLKANVPNLAASGHCILLLTEKAADSPFVFYEAVLSDWLTKPIIVAVFQSCANQIRLSLSALLSNKRSINFETSLYLDGLDLLFDEIKPARAVSGVVFEQNYLRQIAEGVRPFRETVKQIRASIDTPELPATAVPTSTMSSGLKPAPKIFISYHWDHQLRVRNLIRHLKASNFSCWSDMEHVTRRPLTQAASRMTPVATSRMSFVHDNLTTEIENNIKDASAVLLCVTPRYLQSSSFLREVSAASANSRPIIVALLQWVAWPPDSVPGHVKRLFASVRCIDISNEKLFSRNMSTLISHLSRVTTK